MAGDELENTELIYLKLKNDTIKTTKASSNILKFPLRIGIVQKDNLDVSLKEVAVRRAIDHLNKSFEEVGFEFFIEKVDMIISEMYLEDLSKDLYNPYNDFTDKYDLPNMISIYIFEHGHDFCTITENSISCVRTGGFSYILSRKTNNLVLSKFDLKDQKVVAHEFGHFFGLYHTFEEMQFGKDNFDVENCNLVGDRICDTPPDPGAIFEVYVNYSNCEMNELKNEKGLEYKPSIENYMSYYKPCYLKKYSFSAGQIEVLKTAGNSEIRKIFSK